MSYRESFRAAVLQRWQELGRGMGRQVYSVCLSGLDVALLDTLADHLHEHDLRLRRIERALVGRLDRPEDAEYRNFMLRGPSELIKIETDPSVPKNEARLEAGPGRDQQDRIINLKPPE